MKDRKEKSQLKIDWAKLIIFILIIAAIIIFSMYPYIKPRRTLFCYFEQNVTDSSLERYECVNLKVMSKDIDKIDLSKFLALNITSVGCYNSYDKLPKCKVPDPLEGNMFFVEYPLKAFCEDCDVDGILCAEYYVTYSSFDAKIYYIYMQQFTSEEPTEFFLHEKFEECRP